MGSLTERLQYILSADSDQFVGSMTKAGAAAEKELGKAEGKLDKVGGQLTKFGVGAMAASVVAGGALLKTAMSFSDLGVEVGKFSEATGASLDASGRWIEVAGDMGIGADTVEGAFAKMNKAADKTPKLFDDIGASIVRTKDGGVDVSGTFLSVTDALNSISDPAARQVAAAGILGKGWQGMAELIGAGSTTLQTSLAGVADAKVFDKAKLQEAKDFRADIDTLKDSLEELALSIGRGAAPVLGGLASAIGTAVSAFGSLDSVTGGWLGRMATIGTVAVGAVGALSSITGQAIKMRDKFTDVGDDGVRSLNKLGKAAGVLGGVIGAAAVIYSVYSTNKEKAAQYTLELRDALLLEGAAQGQALGAMAASDVDTRKYMETMKRLGVTTTDLARFMKDGTGPVFDITEAYQRAGGAGSDLMNTARLMREELKLGGDVTDAQVQSIIAFVRESYNLKDAQENATSAQELANEVTKDGTTATDDQADSTEKLAYSNKALEGSTTQLIDAINRQKDASTALHDIEQKVRDDALSAIDAQAGYNQSLVTTNLALIDYNTTQAEGKLTALESTGATLSMADSVYQLGQKFADTQGHARDSAAGINDQILKLSEFRDTIDPSSPLYAAIQGYINQLNNIPKMITTKLQLQRFETIVGSVGNSAALNDAVHNGYASGTDSATPGRHPVAENGMEIVVGPGVRNFQGGEQVLNNAATRKLLGGGVHIQNVNLNNYTDEAGFLQRLRFGMAGV